MPRKVPQTNVRSHPISRRSPRQRRSSASGPKQTSERELNSTLGTVSALETKLNELRKTGNIVARTNKGPTAAIAYLRTSSAANVGADRDSERRRRQAIEGFAKRGGFDVVAEFYDAAVSGADPIQDRPGFAQLLDRIEGNGVRVVIVQDASRFARELMAQKLGITLLINRRVRLLTAGGEHD